MEKRDLISMFFLSIVTLGIYHIYWIVKTKTAMNKLGAHIPTAWLMIVPFVNFYFGWKFCNAFAEKVQKDNNEISYFLLYVLLPFISMLIFQYYINQKVKA